MPYLESSFRLSSLEFLEPGSTFLLSVPTADEAILIGTTSPRDFRKLSVTTNAETVVIQREDETPLSLDEVVGERRRSLLSSPVPQFVLKHTSMFGQWKLEDGKEAIINNPRCLRGFFELVADFALRKQIQIAEQAEQQRINTLLES